MYQINDDKSIYVTRGDYCYIPVTATIEGNPYQFQPGDMVRFKVFRKKDCNTIVIQRDFTVETAADSFVISLTGEDTKIGEVISKPVDYWYEVELNPETDHPQTIVAYDEDGPKVFTLYPEGKDVDAEDIEVVGRKTLQELVDYALLQAKESGEFDGEDGKDGVDGQDGYTPVKGTDYFTDEDKDEIADDVAQNVLPLCSNALKATASGEIVRVDDVSPIAKTAVAVVRGKNYANINKMLNNNLVDNGDGSYTFTKIDGTRFSVEYILDRPIPANTLISASIASYEGTAPTMTIQVLKADREESNNLFVNASAKSKSIVLSYDVARVRLCINNSEADGVWVTFSGLQLETGEATDYEPYIDPTTVTVTRYGADETDNPQTFTPSADGSCEIPSLSPTMTLLTDTDGVSITVEYNQDTNKAMGDVKADLKELDDTTAKLLPAENAVLYTNQTLTPEQQAQVRANIGAAKPDYVTPQMFGAVGDGVSDDTDCIRLARSKAIEEKKALYFPAGTYLVHGSIELWSGCEIYGDGNKTIIKKTPAITEVLKPHGTAGSFVAGQTVFTVNDGSKYTVGDGFYMGVNWENAEGVRGWIESISGNTITVKTYPIFRNADGELEDGIPTGLLVSVNNKHTTVVFSTSFPVFCANRHTEDRSWNALHDVYIHDLSIDGNRQSDEAKAYTLSAIHFDSLEIVRVTNIEQTVVSPHENIRLENVDIQNSPADGISIQSCKNVCVANCIAEHCGYNGVHFGVGTVGGSIVGCKLNADYCGFYDCIGVNSVSLSSNHFENCMYGVGGVDQYTRGLTVNGNTFRGCGIGVHAGATVNPKAMTDDIPAQVYNGVPKNGVTICNNTFYGVDMVGTGISFTNGECTTVNGNTFRNLEKALEMGVTTRAYIANNIINDCAAVLAMGINPQTRAVDGSITSQSAFVGNVVCAEMDGASASVSITYADNMLVSGNVVSGTGASVSADAANTTNVILENNIIVA